LVSTLATTVPTFFMRLKPTSSMAKPACMNITRIAATTTHTVSAPTAADWATVPGSGGVVSAKAAAGARAATSPRLDASSSFRFMAEKATAPRVPPPTSAPH